MNKPVLFYGNPSQLGFRRAYRGRSRVEALSFGARAGLMAAKLAIVIRNRIYIPIKYYIVAEISGNNIHIFC